MAILDLIDLKKVNKELQALNIINDVMARINLDSEEKNNIQNFIYYEIDKRVKSIDEFISKKEKALYQSIR
ncbi:hypothetical protein ABS243_19435, partial [Acinetobacter baumannii]|uniref:hypothetical protein n=2 Tax=Bacteria TaxID=2 RepID=UPI00332624F7